MGRENALPDGGEPRATNPETPETSPSYGDSTPVSQPTPAKAQGRSNWVFRAAVLFAALAVLAAAGSMAMLRGGRSRSWFDVLRLRPTAAANAEKQRARELYLAGRFAWNKRTPESLNQALDDFTQSIVHDPANAQAYAGLADTYNLLREFGTMPRNEAYERSLAAATKAVELDDSLAEGHRALAFNLVWYRWDFVDGEREFEKAITLKPNDALAHLWFANAFAGPGWYGICLQEIDRAQELDPTSRTILADRAALMWGVGRHAEALTALRQLEASDPDYVSVHKDLARFSYQAGDNDTYLRENEMVAALTHDPVLKQIVDAARTGYRGAGRHGMVVAVYRTEKKFYAKGSVDSIEMALASLRVGRKDEAVARLREAWERHDPSFIDMYKRADELENLKGYPGFSELTGKLNVPSPDDALRALLNRN